MSWAPIEEEKPKKHLYEQGASGFIPTSDKFLHERSGDKIIRARTGPLARVRLDPEHGWAQRKLSKRALMIHERLLETYGIGQKVRIKEIARLFPDLKPRVVAVHCTYLWLHGYLEKWALGEYLRGWKSNGKTGKYHGVFYEVKAPTGRAGSPAG